MIKQAIAGLMLATATSMASAEVWYYTEYKHDMLFEDEHYVNNSARNQMRFGAQGTIFYIELGPAEQAGEWGASLEAGYNYNISNSWEIKGEVETYQFDQNEGLIDSKVETELRYYFN